MWTRNRLMLLCRLILLLFVTSAAHSQEDASKVSVDPCSLVLRSEAENLLGFTATQEQGRDGKTCSYKRKGQSSELRIQVDLQASFAPPANEIVGVMSRGRDVALMIDSRPDLTLPNRSIGLRGAQPVGLATRIDGGISLGYAYTNGLAIGIYKSTGIASITLIADLKANPELLKGFLKIAQEASGRF